MPSTNRNAWFTPCVRIVKWATIYYKNHGCSRVTDRVTCASVYCWCYTHTKYKLLVFLPILKSVSSLEKSEAYSIFHFKKMEKVKRIFHSQLPLVFLVYFQCKLIEQNWFFVWKKYFNCSWVSVSLHLVLQLHLVTRTNIISF